MRPRQGADNETQVSCGRGRAQHDRSGMQMASAIPLADSPIQSAGPARAVLDLVKLTPLMARTPGRAEIAVGLVDGPVALDHRELVRERIRDIPGGPTGSCSRPDTSACSHGTFTAGILSARRGSSAPGLCPGCTLLLRPIFTDSALNQLGVASATADELASAIVDTVSAGARVLNLSLALVHSSSAGERQLQEALSYALHRGALVVVAAGNEGTMGSSVMTRHPWVIPVGACDLHGRPLTQSNFGPTIGMRGLLAPGQEVTSLGSGGGAVRAGGTSVAAPFVTGAVALLWSEFPHATANEIRVAVTHATAWRRPTIVPPLLNAWAAFRYMMAPQERG